MAVVSMKSLLEAGVHFGHQTRRWNPKMAPYIYTERNGIYIIDLQKTVKKIEEAYNFVRDLAANGENILFVGTKKQAQDAIKEEAERVDQYYVNARWLGGMLTNFIDVLACIFQRADCIVLQFDLIRSVQICLVGKAHLLGRFDVERNALFHVGNGRLDGIAHAGKHILFHHGRNRSVRCPFDDNLYLFHSRVCYFVSGCPGRGLISAPSPG